MIWTKEQVITYLEKDKEWDIYECKKKQQKSIRSMAQNKYYHAVICKVISDWSWDDTIWVHYMLKGMFKLETTTDLSTDEFAFMCKSIISLFKENYDVTIPTPTNSNEEQSLMATLWF